MQQKQEVSQTGCLQQTKQFCDKYTVLIKKRNMSELDKYDYISSTYFQKTIKSPNIKNQPNCKTEQRAKTVLLEQSETDRDQFYKKYDIEKQNSKHIIKGKNQGIFARSQQNKISYFAQDQFVELQKNLIHTNNIREQKNILNSYFLQSKGKFWNNRYKMRSQSSQINRLDKVANYNKQTKQRKKENKLNAYKIVINAPQFGVILPRRNSIHKTKKWKQFESKNQQARIKKALHKKQDRCLQQSLKRRQGIQVISLQAKKFADPHFKNSTSLKMQERVNSFVNGPAKSNNNLSGQKNSIFHQLKNQHNRPIIIGYSNHKFLHRNQRNKSEGNLENNFSKFNLRNIFKRLKQMKTQQLLTKFDRQEVKIQNNLFKKTRRQQSDENDLIDKLNQQRYKIIRNNNRLKSNKQLKHSERLLKEENLSSAQRHLRIQQYPRQSQYNHSKQQNFN